MNTNACRFAWIVLGGACVAGPAPQSQAAERGAYAYGDAGAVFTDDIQVREFPGAASGGKLKLDAGGRFSVGGGYRFSDWLLLGGETGVFANEVQGADASVAQLPFLANLELHLPNKSPLVPFIGGGAGVSFSMISLDHASLNGGTEVDGADSDAVFAWQVYGGLRWKINQRMAVGLVYKYFEAGSPSWEVENSSQQIRLGKTRTHSVSASFSIQF